MAENITKNTLEPIYLGSSQLGNLEMDTLKLSESELSTATDRIEKLRKGYLLAHRNLDIERARIYHEMFFLSDELKGDTQMVAHAKFFKRYCNERTIYIEDGQLIAGSFGKEQRSIPAYPETFGGELMDEFRKLPTRRIDAFEISDEDLDELEQIFKDLSLPSLRSRTFSCLTDDEKALFLKDPANDPVTISRVFGLDIALNGPGGHISPDYQTVIEEGLSAIRRKAELRLLQAEAEKDAKAIDFLSAVIISLDGFHDLALRYSALAKEKAAAETDPIRKAELLKLADACEQVPWKPARSFYESCQCVWFLFVGIQMEALHKCYCVGRFDQFTYPLYKADLDNGVMTKGEAQEYIDCLFLKFPETNYINSDANQTAAGFSVQQQFVVGGQTVDGQDATNDLSYQILQGTINTRLGQPSVSVRMWDGTPHELYKKAAEVVRLGTGHPSFFCDDVIIPALISKDVLPEDARDYSVVGCSGVQLTRKDKGGHNAGYMNLASVLEFALYNGYWPYGDRQMSIKTGNPVDFGTFDDLLAAFQKQMEFLLKIYTETTVKIEEAHRELCPTPFLSSFVQDCISRGRDRTDGGAVYNSGMTSRAVGMGTVADALISIKKLVYDDKSLTMTQMLDAMKDNFVGHDDVVALINSAPKYGNDDDYADDVAREVTKIYANAQDQHRSLFGGRFHPGFSTISANVSYGEVVSALPDGRKAYTPITEGVSPNHHADVEGPTAVALSSAKLYHEGLSGGSILNVRLSPNSIEGDEGLEKLVAYIKGLQKAGVWHTQFNINDVEMLRDAQKNPEKYADLLLRVAGYSTFFIGLPDKLQEDIIDRTVHGL